MKKEDFIQIVEKFAKGEAASNETKVIETFFNIHKEENIIPSFQNNERENILEKVKKQLPKENQFSPVYYKIASIAAITLVIFFCFQFFGQPSTITQVTAKGEKKEVILQDGSMVMLNANSSIVYTRDFETDRHIKLKGQAFFKVRRDEEHPFIVSTSKIKVQVLGTSFDVNANAFANPTVSVVSGVVNVSDYKNKENNLIIRKNEQVVFDNNRLKYTKTDSDINTAWTHNTIHLHNNTLKETASILENWYNLKISFEDKKLEKLRISGKYKNEKIENIIKSIALLKHLKIDTLTTKHILIRENKSLN